MSSSGYSGSSRSVFSGSATVGMVTNVTSLVFRSRSPYACLSSALTEPRPVSTVTALVATVPHAVPGADELKRLVAGDEMPARGQLQMAERVVDGLLQAHLDAAD